MTTGVNVDFILNCFFTCKDRALERDRPYQRKKNASASAATLISFISSVLAAANVASSAGVGFFLSARPGKSSNLHWSWKFVLEYRS